mgnify:CR=1 FL=1
MISEEGGDYTVRDDYAEDTYKQAEAFADSLYEKAQAQVRERHKLLKFKHGYFRLKQENEDLREQVAEKESKLSEMDDAIEYYILLTHELRCALASGDEAEKERLLGEAVVV